MQIEDTKIKPLDHHRNRQELHDIFPCARQFQATERELTLEPWRTVDKNVAQDKTEKLTSAILPAILLYVLVPFKYSRQKLKNTTEFGTHISFGISHEPHWGSYEFPKPMAVLLAAVWSTRIKNATFSLLHYSGLRVLPTDKSFDNYCTHIPPFIVNCPLPCLELKTGPTSII